jgi:mRNA-degrading endonuclease RelE of RelBE toxin-antitoxin system
MEISFAPQFKRKFKKLPQALRREIHEKIELFKNIGSHPLLHIHKLKGELEGRLSFSANYRYRIIFMWEVKNESAIFLIVGDHAVYD